MDTEHGMTFETLKVHPTALLLFMLLKADKINGVNVLLATKAERMNAGSVQKNVCNLINNAIGNAYKIIHNQLPNASLDNDRMET